MSKVLNEGSLYGKIGISGAQDRLPDYAGPYSVTPTIPGEVLPTKDKSMLDDLNIEPIPYQEVSNPSGGITATIGGY